MRGTTLARRALDAFPALRTITDAPIARQVIQTGRAARALQPAGRFVVNQRRRATVDEYRLRGTEATVYLRRRTRDVDILAEIFTAGSYEPPRQVEPRLRGPLRDPRSRRQRRPVRPLCAATLAGQHCRVLRARPGELRAAGSRPRPRTRAGESMRRRSPMTPSRSVRHRALRGRARRHRGGPRDQRSLRRPVHLHRLTALRSHQDGHRGWRMADPHRPPAGAAAGAGPRHGMARAPLPARLPACVRGRPARHRRVRSPVPRTRPVCLQRPAVGVALTGGGRSMTRTQRTNSSKSNELFVLL